MIRTVTRSSDRIDLLQHHRSLTACIEYIIDRKHVEESQADGESHKTMRVVTSLSSCRFMSYLRVHEASSRQTLNVESKDVQYHGLVHESMKISNEKEKLIPTS